MGLFTLTRRFGGRGGGMNDDLRIKRNNYNVHEHVISPLPPPNVRNNVKSIGMRNGVQN